jgi:hypothetical protein
MSTAVKLLVGDPAQLNQVGSAQRGAGYYTTSINGGWHTISVDVTDFTGRIYIQATMAANPQESDWFPVYLSADAEYVQYPSNPMQLRGGSAHGDTATDGWTFRGNFTFVRARVDRSYLTDTTNVGNAREILMGL